MNIVSGLFNWCLSHRDVFTFHFLPESTDPDECSGFSILQGFISLSSLLQLILNIFEHMPQGGVVQHQNLPRGGRPDLLQGANA